MQETPEGPTTGADDPPSRADDPERGSPCEVDGAQWCALDGDTIYVCEEEQWDERHCRAECKALAPQTCSIGCLIADEGDRCLCVPCK